MIGGLFRTIGPFAPPPPPGAQPPPLWGSEAHLRELFGDRVDIRAEREVLDVTAFSAPHDYGEHFKARYGPTIAARANAEKNGREGEFDAALDASATSGTAATADRRASTWSTCSRSGRASRADRHGAAARRAAAAAASRREATPSFCSTAETWWSTVLGAMTSVSAISAFVAPAVRRSSTST